MPTFIKETFFYIVAQIFDSFSIPIIYNHNASSSLQLQLFRCNVLQFFQEVHHWLPHLPLPCICRLQNINPVPQNRISRSVRTRVHQTHRQSKCPHHDFPHFKHPGYHPPNHSRRRQQKCTQRMIYSQHINHNFKYQFHS